MDKTILSSVRCEDFWWTSFGTINPSVILLSFATRFPSRMSLTDWRLFDRLRLPYQPCSSGGMASYAERTPPHALPVDPVDPDLVGRVNISEMYRFAVERNYAFAVAVLLLLRTGQPEEVLLPESERDQPLPWLFTHDRWKNVVEEYARSGILEVHSSSVAEADRMGYLLSASRVFGVEKGITEIARGVFSGRLLSLLCRVPETVNLCEIRDFIKLAVQLFTRAPAFFQLDFRHWFHQIPSGDGLRRLFGVLHNGIAYCYSAIPMGWSESPRIAQSISWIFILFRLKHEEEFFEVSTLSENSGHPPRFIYIVTKQGKRIGFVSVLYDNVGFFCADFEAAEKIQKRFQVNSARLHAIIKPGSIRLVSPKQLRSSVPENWPVHIGVQFRWQEERLRWRVDPAAVSRWAERPVLEPDTKISPRSVAQVVGCVMWHCMVGFVRLHRVAPALAILSRVSRIVHGNKSNWDKLLVTLSIEEAISIGEIWSMVLQNLWQSESQEENSSEVIVATDASGHDGWGYVVMSMDGVILEQAAFGWSEKQKDWHIFLKELGAPLWTAEKISDSLVEKKVFFVIDNTSARAALARGFSTNALATRMVLDTDMIMKKLRISPVYLGIPGKKNIADRPSHQMVADPSYTKYAVEVVKNHKNGTVSKIASIAPQKSVEFGSRHYDPSEDEENENASVELSDVQETMLMMEEVSLKD